MPIIAIAAVVRLAMVFILSNMPPVNDALDYVEAGKLLAERGSSSAFYWPPGMPVVLAGVYWVFGPSLCATRSVVLVLGVTCVLLSTLLARCVAAKVRVSVLCGLLGACYLPAVLLAGQPFSQHLASVCLLGVAICGQKLISTLRWRWCVPLGLALGVGCLTRPSMLSVFPVAAVYLLAAGRVFRCDEKQARARSAWAMPARVLAALTLAGALVLPAMWHNARHSAGWTISTNNERNLFLGNNPYTPHYKTSYLASRPLDVLDPKVRAYLSSFYLRADAREAMKAEAERYMIEHPGITLYRTFNRIQAFWGFDYVGSREIQKWYGMDTRSAAPLLCAEAGCSVAVLLLALVGVLVFWRETHPAWSLWLLTLILAYQAPYALAFSEGTYHFPVVWLILPFAGTTLARISSASDRADLFERLKARPLVRAALLVFIALQIQYAYFTLKMT